eukprot:766407-Hanusia_phi.AAC.6
MTSWSSREVSTGEGEKEKTINEGGGGWEGKRASYGARYSRVLLPPCAGLASKSRGITPTPSIILVHYTPMKFHYPPDLSEGAASTPTNHLFITGT